MIVPRRIFRFAVIGGSASATHWLTVFAIVHQTSMDPLLANVIAFLCAFLVSYVGHKNWTFEARDQAHAGALAKFFTVAIIGFAINESLYALLLKVMHIHYLIGLTIAIIAAAISTYVLSQSWAFKGRKKEELP